MQCYVEPANTCICPLPILKPVQDNNKCPMSICGYTREKKGTPWVLCSLCRMCWTELIRYLKKQSLLSKSNNVLKKTFSFYVHMYVAILLYRSTYVQKGYVATQGRQLTARHIRHSCQGSLSINTQKTYNSGKAWYKQFCSSIGRPSTPPLKRFYSFSYLI